MRISHLSALAGLIAIVSAAPLLDVESTTLSIDSSREVLDNGGVALHLTRVDDLIDEDNDYKLLLERVTHIALSLQLDVPDGSISINGQRLPLAAPQGEGMSVTMIQAEAFSLPLDLPAAFYEPEHVQSMVDSLSKGIVSVEVRLESESVPVDAIGSVIDEETVTIVPVDGVSLRKVGVFVKINEIEGQSLAHSEIIYTPIVQLLVEAENGSNGEKIKQISTLSVGGEPVSAEAAHSLPSDSFPDLLGLLPPLEESKPEESQMDAEYDIISAHDLENENDIVSGGFLDFFRAMVEQPKYEAPAAGQHVRRPCPGMMRGARKGHPFSSDSTEDNEESRPFLRHAHNGVNNTSSRHGPHHPHGHHRSGCFMRNFLSGFASAFSSIFHFISAILVSLPGAIFTALAIGGFAFTITRSIVRHIRERRAFSHESLPQYIDDLEEGSVVEEKIEPPSYSENMPLFDADVEDEKKETDA